MADTDCKDGVCSIVDKADTVQFGDAGMVDKEKELIKLGWSMESAQRALNETNSDVAAAADLLFKEEDAREAFRPAALRLGREEGWTEEATVSALVESNGNETLALDLLRSEEAAIQLHFERAVQDMLASGWDEVVARRALLAQWTLDQRKALKGANTVTSSSREVLDDIRPKLRREVGRETMRAPTGSRHRTKKEDCVFDVNASNFQRIVLESPVPVVLDCYADWCQPCKQLGPILETAAVESGGAFRLAKLNTDAERSFAEALQVTGLPTIFAVSRRGRLIDRAVGLPPKEQIEKFLLRALTGKGERIQVDADDADLAVASSKIAMMAGLAALNSKQRQQLRQMVDAVVEMEGAVDDDGTMSRGMKTALVYISNAAKDVRESKFRSINQTSKGFIEKISTSPAACKILEVAGFRSQNGSAEILTLVHSNVAVLTLVGQRAGDAVQTLRFKKERTDMGENPSLRKKR